MAVVLADSFLGALIPPSIWKGYTLPRSVIMGEKLPYQGMVLVKGVPQEWTDEMMNIFQNGSVAEFYDKYLENIFTIQDHEQVLVEAEEILRTDLQKLRPFADPLIAVASIDIAHNAYLYGHHLFKTACFLKKQKQLPKECQFVLGRKINPGLYDYGEKEQFNQVVKFLAEPAQKIPHSWTQEAFNQWTKENDSSDYLSQMKKMATLELVLAEKGKMPVEYAVKNYLHEHHEPTYRRRSYPRRQNWRRHE